MLARDDWGDVFQDHYPLLDEIAEFGAELETTEDTEYAANIIHEIKEKLGQINWYNNLVFFSISTGVFFVCSKNDSL